MSTKTETLAAATVSDPRWAAVVTRDARCDGQFVYSVRTTGVYCRPSCAARAARPENIAFHATAADAQRCGFRPCKRCNPDQPSLRLRVRGLGGVGGPADKTNSTKENTPPIAQAITQ
jgi:AraC family transcriptional regulator, regulatory protein of adaptative response / methylated-DNA-[protein]-cysteine methyltransferase